MDDIKREALTLLSAFVDSVVLPDVEITEEQWVKACMLCGRYKEPFIEAANDYDGSLTDY